MSADRVVVTCLTVQPIGRMGHSGVTGAPGEQGILVKIHTANENSPLGLDSKSEIKIFNCPWGYSQNPNSGD